MGNDGCTVPTLRRFCVNTKKEEKTDYNAIKKCKSNICSISGSRLQAPVVGCKKGHLYNKEAILEK